ncbi:MAG: ABC transporter ATP-binding protein [Lentisphaeria bacterium]|nr:ABC transporter ATP-binding protein [Lentisphaeria bacterium]
MIRTEDLTLDFGGGRGVFHLNMDVPDGSIYGFVGHNGAGKTTTIKILCGLLRPDSGRAFIGDVEIVPKNLAKIKRSIGYMPDITGVYDQMSVWEFLDFYGAAFKIPPKDRRKRIETVLELTHATDMMDYQVSSLSRGMRQKIGLAKTLVHDPDVLILDEPAGGLDPNARIEMRQTIAGLRELGKTILLSSHILPELASICDRVGIINRGVLLAQGTVKEISSKLQENLQILITVDSDVQEALRAVSEIPNVQNASAADAEHLSLSFTGGREGAGGLLAALQAKGVKVRWFTENEASLENVFINITSADQGKAGQDA